MHGLVALFLEVIVLAIILLLVGPFDLVVLIVVTKVIVALIVLMPIVRLGHCDCVGQFDGSSDSCNNAAGSLNHGCVLWDDELSSSILAASFPWRSSQERYVKN